MSEENLQGWSKERKEREEPEEEEKQLQLELELVWLHQQLMWKGNPCGEDYVLYPQH